MQRSLFAVIIFFCIAPFHSVAQACTCGEYRTPVCAQYSRSDAVFIGQLETIKPLESHPEDGDRYNALHFVIQESYKGVASKRVVVGTSTGTTCSIPFKEGTRYLVFASLDKETQQLFTGMCSGTGSANHLSSEVLDYLRKVTHQGVQETISGRITQNSYMNAPGVTVQLIGGKKQVTTKTDKSGAFSFSLPGPGEFKVRVVVPYAASFLHFYDKRNVKQDKSDSLSTFEYFVSLKKNGCEYLELDMYGTDPRATAIVAGNVLTATGEAVRTGGIGLINISDTGRDYFEAVENGSFKFDQIAAGEYHLVLNAYDEVPEENSPDPRTYYPGTVDQREAKKIVITDGATVANLMFRAAPRLSERRVAGVVAWNDGRRLRFPYLAVYASDRHVRRIEVDATGNFNVVLYGDFDYSLEAREDVGEAAGRSERIKVPHADVTGLNLTLNPLPKNQQN